MPRLALTLTGNRYSQPELYKVAEGIECGSLAYVTATDYFSTSQPIMMRCVMAGCIWVAYGHLLDNM